MHRDNITLETLKDRSDFVLLNKKADKWVSKTVVVQCYKNLKKHPSSPAIHIGYTVTKKTFKSAVKRNRVKRRLRSVASEIITQYANPDFIYVLIGREETLTRPFDAIKNDLKWCLKRLDALKKDQ